MEEDIETLMKKVDLYGKRSMKREPTELERLESLLTYDEVLESVGDIDSYERILEDIETDLDIILNTLNEYNEEKRSHGRTRKNTMVHLNVKRSLKTN
jgi:hypothetical protein